ncbi:uncharacterized protein [Centruroides vittatus]|uniref:uncharacterized protein n=1 Tax=Centruroides vittatus TaxID=120091 RepID=UPI00350F3650
MRKNKITLVRADKTKAMVIMKQQTYEKLLVDYINLTQCKKVENSNVEKLQNRVKRFAKTKLAKRLDNKNIVLDSPDAPRLFGFAKTHKQGMQIRPVVDKTRAPTRKLEDVMHAIIAPHLEDYEFSISDSLELITILKQMHTAPAYLTVLDFKSMYPSVLLSPTFCALRDLLLKIVEDSNHHQQILELAHLLCYNSLFQFKGCIYQQRRGMPMGSTIAGDLCEMVVRLFEQKVLPDQLHNIIIYKRYVDDILIRWKCKPDILTFVAEFNNNSYGLTLGLEQESYTQVHFLDVNITVKGSAICTEVYRKSHVDQLYIPAQSCDPMKYKIAAFNSLVKRAYTHSSTTQALTNEINTINTIAERHGYSNLVAALCKKTLHPPGATRAEGQSQQDSVG